MQNSIYFIWSIFLFLFSIYQKCVFIFHLSAWLFVSKQHLLPNFSHYFQKGAVFSLYEYGCSCHTLCNNAMFAATDWHIVSRTQNLSFNVTFLLCIRSVQLCLFIGEQMSMTWSTATLFLMIWRLFCTCTVQRIKRKDVIYFLL